MPDNNSLIVIRERLKVIDAEITKREAERAEVDAAIEELRAERSEFEVAERVLLRIQGSEPTPQEDKPAMKPNPRKAAANGHAPREVALRRRLHAMRKDTA